MVSLIAAEDCASMADVRRGVDAIDRALVDLLAERFRFMAAAARIKPERALVRDAARKHAVKAAAEAAAVAAGIPPGVAASLWELLIEASIAYELAAFDAHDWRE